MRLIYWIVLLAGALFISGSWTTAAAPANDDFDHAIDLGSVSLPILEGTTEGATPGPMESVTMMSGLPIGRSAVWFKWTAPSSGTIRFAATLGYTLVSSFRSESGVPDAMVAQDNGVFAAEAGVTYFFAVSTTTGYTGEFSVRVSSLNTPPNDAFADAITLDSAPVKVEVSGNAEGATVEPDEPGPPSTEFGSIWFKWTPRVSGRVRYASLTRVFGVNWFTAKGPSLRDLVRLADFFNPPEVAAGVTYYIAVNGRQPVHFWIEVASGPPANDALEAAERLEMANDVIEAEGTTFDASPDGWDFPKPGADTVWYQWVADRTGAVAVDLFFQDEGFSERGCWVFREGDGGSIGSVVGSDGQTIGVTAGVRYWFQVFAYRASDGPFRLTVRRAQSMVNDRFAAAPEVWVEPGSQIPGVTTTGATLEADEPSPPGSLGSVWYRLIPVELCRLCATPPDSNTSWTVYSGKSLATLQKVDPPDLIPGIKYYLSLTTTSSTGSSFDFKLEPVPILANANDFFADAIPLEGRTNILHGGSVTAATGEPGEPFGRPFGEKTSLWWRYAAKTSGWLIIRPPGDMYDAPWQSFTPRRLSVTPRVAIYAGSSLATLTYLNEGTSKTRVEAGQTYSIQVEHSNFNLAEGDLLLIFSEGAENDNFAQAMEIDIPSDDRTIAIAGDNAGAGKEDGEGISAWGQGATVWYHWRASFDGLIEVAVEGELQVYEGSTLAALREAGPVLGVLPVKMGEDYYFQIDSAARDSGVFTLAIRGNKYDVENDRFAGARDLPLNTMSRACVDNATMEAGEPVHMAGPIKSLWWKYRAPPEGDTVVFSAHVWQSRVTVGIYRGGPSIQDLELVAWADDNQVPRFASLGINAEPQQEFYVALTVPADASGLAEVFMVSQRFRDGPYWQTVAMEPVPTQELGGGPIQLKAAVSAGLPVVFTVIRGPAVVEGSTLTLLGAGIVSVRASQAGNGPYLPAETAVTFGVRQRPQAIQFDPVNTLARPVTLTASSSAGLPVQFEVVSGPASLQGNVLVDAGSGPITVRASQPGNRDVEAAEPVTRVFTVNRFEQRVEFDPLPDVTAGTPSIGLTAKASSGLPVTFSVVQGDASVSGAILHLGSAGVVTVRASQSGNEQFAPVEVDRSFRVVALGQTIAWTEIPQLYVGDVGESLTASASSGLPVSFQLLSGPGELNGSMLRATGPGTIVVRAFQPGNAAYEAAPEVERSFEVLRFSQSIERLALPPLRFGDAPLALVGRASSGLPVTFQLVSGPAFLTGNTLTITGAGAVTLRAIQEGSDRFLAAPDLTFSLIVERARQSIVFPAPDRALLYDQRIQLRAQASSGLPVKLRVLSGPGELNDDNVLYANNYGEILVEAAQEGDGNYEPASVTQVIRVPVLPELSGILTDGKLVIRWLGTGSPFQLESAAKLDGPWRPVPASDNSGTIEIPKRGGVEIFRLRLIE